MADSLPYIPSLSSYSGFITKVADKAAYILRHFIYNPAGVSDFFEDGQLSLRMLAAKYQQSPVILASVAQTTLRNAYAKCIPEMNIDVDISYKDIDGSKYKLVFNITGSPVNLNIEKKPLIMSGSMSIDDDYRISLTFAP